MKLKTFAFSMLLTISVSTFASNTDPGPLTITVNGVDYRVFVEFLPANTSLLSDQISKLQNSPWYGNSILAERFAAAYWVASTGYSPNNSAIDGPYIFTNINTANAPYTYAARYAERNLDNNNQIFVGGAGGIIPDVNSIYYLMYVTGPSPIDTLASFQSNALALHNAFNLQSAKIAQGLSYDCKVYDQKNICVSFAGSKSDGKGFDATTGALIIAHKPTNHFRFGGYIDQSFGSSTSGGLTTKKGNPSFGAFAVWSQNADGSGVQVRAAANVGKVDIETKREAIGTAEAGEGQSNIKSQGFSLEVSKDYAINSMWTARPYVGYRQTTNTRAGYTETQGAESPLTYGSLKQTTETLTAGATFAHTLSAKTTLFLTAGVEHDLKNSIGRYAATSPDIEGIDSIDISSNKTKTRPTVSFALNHDIDKTQRVGVSLTHRKEAFASGSTTSAFLQYSKGF